MIKVSMTPMSSILNGTSTPKPVTPYIKLLDKLESQNIQVGKIVTLNPLFTKDGWLKRFGKIQYEILDIKRYGKAPWVDKVRLRKLWTKAKGTKETMYETFAHTVYDDSICNGKHTIKHLSGMDICSKCGFMPDPMTQQRYSNIIW